MKLDSEATHRIRDLIELLRTLETMSTALSAMKAMGMAFDGPQLKAHLDRHCAVIVKALTEDTE